MGSGNGRGKGGRWEINLLAKLVSPFCTRVTSRYSPRWRACSQASGSSKRVGSGRNRGKSRKSAQYCAIEKRLKGGSQEKGAGARRNWRQAIWNPCPYLYTASGRLSFPRARSGKQKSKLCKLMGKGGELSPCSLRQSRSPFTRALGLRWFKRKIWGCSQSTPPPTSPPPPPPLTELSYLRPAFIWIINILVLFLSVVWLSFYYV